MFNILCITWGVSALLIAFFNFRKYKGKLFISCALWRSKDDSQLAALVLQSLPSIYCASICQVKEKKCDALVVTYFWGSVWIISTFVKMKRYPDTHGSATNRLHHNLLIKSSNPHYGQYCKTIRYAKIDDAFLSKRFKIRYKLSKCFIV